jgi:two-component system, LytTR family, sensor kinase
VNNLIKFLKKPLSRVSLHLGFWLFIFGLMLFYIPSNLNNTSSIKIKLLLFFSIRDIFLVSFCYYFFIKFVYKNIFAKKFLLAIGSTCIIYLILFFAQIATIEYAKVCPEIFVELGKWLDVFMGGKTYFDRFLNPNFHWALIFWYSIYFFIAITIKIIRDLETYKIRKLNLETENLNYELQRLNNQLNPNFVLKTLHSIQENIKITVPKASEITKKLMNLMSYSLNDSKDDLVPLAKEIQFIEEYISLEKIRHSKKVKIDFQVVGNTENLEIPPLLLITFIENAFKHGINKTIQASWVEIKMTVQNESLEFIVKNSIPSTTRSSEKGGIGLVNVKKRLDLLFDKDYTLLINEKPETFEIELFLKLSNKTALR